MVCVLVASLQIIHFTLNFVVKDQLLDKSIKNYNTLWGGVEFRDIGWWVVEWITREIKSKANLAQHEKDMGWSLLI